MGLIKYGPLAQEVSGTVGGVTFARVHDGKAVRGWRAPVNKQSLLQRFLRHTLAHASSDWFTLLSSGERADWDTYAATCIFTNSLGEPYTISGFNMFVRTQVNLYRSPIAFPPQAPALAGFPDAHTLEFSLTHATGVLALTDLDPVINAFAWVIFLIYRFTKSSRLYPTRYYTSKFIQSGQPALPRTLYTFDAPLPLLAGNVQSVVTWQIFDEHRRLSIPALDMTPSS